jgi:hypothetical protein
LPEITAFFSKAGAKVLLFSDMTKFFCKKMHFFFKKTSFSPFLPLLMYNSG